MLFVELALIRWLGANVVHLSYFSNFVLLGSFLGIGCGFLISNKKWSIWPVSLPLLAALVVAVREFPVTIERQGSDVIYFTALHVSGPPAWQALPVVFVLVAIILAGPAELVGRCFGQLAPLTAYRNDPQVAALQDWDLPYSEEKARALVPDSAPLATALAQAYLQAGRADAAMRVAREARAAAAGDLGLIRVEALAGIRAGRAAEAVSTAETAVGGRRGCDRHRCRARGRDGRPRDRPVR